MTKMRLVKILSEEMGLSKTDASSALDIIFNAVIDAVKDGQKVTLVGFGTFMASERKAREGRNPRTGETISIPSAKVPKFVAGKGFKEAVNK